MTDGAQLTAGAGQLGEAGGKPGRRRKAETPGAGNAERTVTSPRSVLVEGEAGLGTESAGIADRKDTWRVTARSQRCAAGAVRKVTGRTTVQSRRSVSTAGRKDTARQTARNPRNVEDARRRATKWRTVPSLWSAIGAALRVTWFGSVQRKKRPGSSWTRKGRLKRSMFPGLKLMQQNYTSKGFNLESISLSMKIFLFKSQARTLSKRCQVLKKLV